METEFKDCRCFFCGGYPCECKDETSMQITEEVKETKDANTK